MSSGILYSGSETLHMDLRCGSWRWLLFQFVTAPTVGRNLYEPSTLVVVLNRIFLLLLLLRNGSDPNWVKNKGAEYCRCVQLRLYFCSIAIVVTLVAA